MNRVNIFGVLFVGAFLIFPKSSHASDCNAPKYLDMALSVAISMCGDSLNYMWTSIDKKAKRDSANDSKNSIGCKSFLINENEQKIPIKFIILYRMDDKKLVLVDKSDIADCQGS